MKTERQIKDKIVEYETVLQEMGEPCSCGCGCDYDTYDYYRAAIKQLEWVLEGAQDIVKLKVAA